MTTMDWVISLVDVRVRRFKSPFDRRIVYSATALFALRIRVALDATRQPCIEGHPRPWPLIRYRGSRQGAICRRGRRDLTPAGKMVTRVEVPRKSTISTIIYNSSFTPAGLGVIDSVGVVWRSTHLRRWTAA